MNSDVIRKCPKLHLNTSLRLATTVIFEISVLELVRIAMLPKIGQKCPWMSHFGGLCARLIELII